MEFLFLPDSIVNNANNPRDYASPYSFLAFMQYQNFKTSDINDQLKEYQYYINKWAGFKKINKSQERFLVRDAYINLLREITLNFSTEEEKRFILNADFDDDSDLDIIIPFFIQKLKQICFYYNEKRQDVKNSTIKYNLKGSNFGIENIVRKIIYEYVENNLDNKRKELSAFYENFDVSITELYSNTDYFYDKNKKTEHTYTNKIDPNIFINIKQSIIDAISAYPFYLESSSDSIINDFRYNPALSGEELNYLKNRDFINYFENGEDSLKINLFKSLYPKYTGTDVYYLSTNSENQSVSGLLFEGNKFNGQYLNKHFPTSIISQSLNDLYSVYELGGFFIPQNQGILIYNTPKKTYNIDLEKIAPDKVYVFPDPNKIGNTTYTSEQENENIPLTYIIDVSWNRTKISNGFKFNDVLSNNYNQLFYGYESKQQDIKLSTEGIAKITDNITFWNGDKDQIWKGSFDVNKYPIDKDTDKLLLNDGIVVDWYADEYNNEFSLYKEINTYSKETPSNIINDDGVYLDSNTVFDERKANNVSLYEKKNINRGKIFIRNNFYNKTTNIKDALSNDVISLFLVNNVFVIETRNFVISDSYIYDIDSNKFKTKNNQTFYKKKEGINEFLDAFINPWYDETSGKIFLVFLKTLENSLSASNYKYITPEIYSSNLNKTDYIKIYPLANTYTTIYSLSSPFGDVPEINLVEYCGGSFRKNPISNEFNLAYMAKNLNSMPFIVNEKLFYKADTNTFVSETPVLFKPFYYFLDNNYSNPELQYFVRGVSNKSGYLGVKDDNSINIVEHGANKINYAFSSNVDILQINEVGKYIVQFDWDSYNETTIFVGCSSVNVKQIEKNILVTFKNNVLYLTAYNDEKNIFKFEIDGSEFDVNVKRPIFPQNEILIFNVISTNNISFSGTFCGDSIYRKLKIIKSGGGFGEVVTNPPCIDCGDSCEYLYPINSTITLIASAAPKSKFNGWFGDSDCYAQINDCFVYLNDNKTIIADFEPLPLYNVSVNNDFGGVISLDGEINCKIGECSNNYYAGTYVTLSACPPPKGFIFKRFSGAPCYTGNRLCTFIVYSDLKIDSLYSEILYFDISVSVQSDAFTYPILLVNTIAGERELLTHDDKNLIMTPLPQGNVKWEYTYNPILTTYDTDMKSLSEDTFVSLTANPLNADYVFNKWIGGPCDNSKNNICQFVAQGNENIIAYFSLATYTVTVIISGGIGRVFSIPSAIDCDSNQPYSTCEYDFISGRSVSLFADELSGSTFIALCSYDIPSTNSKSTTFKVTKNITLTAVYLPYDSYTLNFYKFGDNRIIFSTSPTSNIDCDLTCISSTDVFPSSTHVDFLTQYASNSKVLFYKTSEPIVNRYYSGFGINLGAPYLDINSGDSNGFIFTDNSLIVKNANLGAPYAESELNGTPDGIIISYTSLDVIMTTDINVSAFIT